MKKLIIILFLVLWANIAFAQEYNLGWDASTSIDVTGYNLYSAPSNIGPWTKCNTEGLITSTEYEFIFTEELEGTIYFYCTAFDGINESLKSNIVSSRLDNILPNAPTNLTISIIFTFGGN